MTQVVAALIWDGPRFLICQRPAHKARGLLWEFVGGKVEPGESKQDALARECREELAVTVSVGSVFKELTHVYPDLTIELTLFHARITQGTIQMLEHADIRWITAAEIPNYDFCPADAEILDAIQTFVSCRCKWCESDSLLQEYHDREWGIGQLHDDRLQFEFLTLEVMQCGLSWMTVLRKREAMRQAFDHFDPRVISQYDDAKINACLNAPGIIHSHTKILAMVGNARSFCAIQDEYGSFDQWFWSFTNGETIQTPRNGDKPLPVKTELSETISKALKKRGFRYLGPVVVYSHMQASGMVNDHEPYCFGYRLLGGVSADKNH